MQHEEQKLAGRAGLVSSELDSMRMELQSLRNRAREAHEELRVMNDPQRRAASRNIGAPELQHSVVSYTDTADGSADEHRVSVNPDYFARRRSTLDSGLNSKQYEKRVMDRLSNFWDGGDGGGAVQSSRLESSGSSSTRIAGETRQRAEIAEARQRKIMRAQQVSRMKLDERRQQRSRRTLARLGIAS